MRGPVQGALQYARPACALVWLTSPPGSLTYLPARGTVLQPCPSWLASASCVCAVAGLRCLVCHDTPGSTRGSRELLSPCLISRYLKAFSDLPVTHLPSRLRVPALSGICVGENVVVSLLCDCVVLCSSRRPSGYQARLRALVSYCDVCGGAA